MIQKPTKFFFHTSEGKLKDGPTELFDGMVIGRKKFCDVKVPDELVSGKHLKVSIKKTKVHITDLGSFNKTYVNGKEIPSGTPFEIQMDDQIQIGNHIFVLSDNAEIKKRSKRKKSTAQSSLTLLGPNENIFSNEDESQVPELELSPSFGKTIDLEDSPPLPPQAEGKKKEDDSLNFVKKLNRQKRKINSIKLKVQEIEDQIKRRGEIEEKYVELESKKSELSKLLSSEKKEDMEKLTQDVQGAKYIIADIKEQKSRLEKEMEALTQQMETILEEEKKQTKIKESAEREINAFNDFSILSKEALELRKEIKELKGQNLESLLEEENKNASLEEQKVKKMQKEYEKAQIEAKLKKREEEQKKKDNIQKEIQALQDKLKKIGS